MPFLSACAESDKTSRGIRVHEPPQPLPSPDFPSRKRETSKSGTVLVEISFQWKEIRSFSALTYSPLIEETRINKERREGKERIHVQENGYTRVRILNVLLCRRPHEQPLKRKDPLKSTFFSLGGFSAKKGIGGPCRPMKMLPFDPGCHHLRYFDKGGALLDHENSITFLIVLGLGDSPFVSTINSLLFNVHSFTLDRLGK